MAMDVLRIVHKTHPVYIDYPTRGEQLDGESNVTVLGRVVDYGVGFESVTVNGVSVELDEMATLSSHLLQHMDSIQSSLSRAPWQAMRLAGPTASITHRLTAYIRKTKPNSRTRRLRTECSSVLDRRHSTIMIIHVRR